MYAEVLQQFQLYVPAQRQQAIRLCFENFLLFPLGQSYRGRASSPAACQQAAGGERPTPARPAGLETALPGMHRFGRCRAKAAGAGRPPHGPLMADPGPASSVKSRRASPEVSPISSLFLRGLTQFSFYQVSFCPRAS